MVQDSVYIPIPDSIASMEMTTKSRNFNCLYPVSEKIITEVYLLYKIYARLTAAPTVETIIPQFTRAYSGHSSFHLVY